MTLTPPPLSNDCFALPQGVNWTPVDEALALLRGRLGPVTGAEAVSLSEALGRVLAEDAIALRSNPPQPNTAVDGYGFAGGRPEGAHVMPLVAGRAAAGVPFNGVVPPGQAIRILTGAALPEGVALIQKGVLDGLSAEEIATGFAPAPGAPVIISRLLDGASAVMDKHKVEANIRAELRPGVGILRASNGHVDITALLGLGMGSEDDIANLPSHHELEHGGETHEHDDFDSFSIRLPAITGKDELLAIIETTIRDHDVLRLKGFAAVPGAAARLAIQAVGPRVTAYFDRPWKVGERRDTALVVIGESPLDHAAITTSLNRALAVAA